MTNTFFFKNNFLQSKQKINNNLVIANKNIYLPTITSKLSNENFSDINNLYNIFVINLKHRIDRLLFMKFKLKELNLSYDVINATYGIDHKVEYNNYISKFNNNEIKLKKVINSLGAYGLLLTYKDKITQLGFKSDKHILIMEDDICFHKNFKEKLLQHSEVIKNNDVIWLGSQQIRWKDYMLESIEKVGYYKSDTSQYYVPWGTYCMIYSPKFLKILNKELQENIDSKNIRNIDIFISIIIEKYKLNSCVIKDDLVLPQVFESDNMGPRDIKELCKERKWNMDLYKYNFATAHFYEIYNKINTGKLSLRSNIPTIDNDITNINLSKIIEQNNNAFTFVITSYNNEKWVDKNLTSIINQDYPFWRIIYVDDCSSDKTNLLVKEFIEKNRISDKVIVIKNKSQIGQAKGRHIAYNMCYDDEICCLLDGDDWLVNDKEILTKLNKLYIEHNLLMSYGQFYYYTGEDENSMFLSGKYSYSQKEINNAHYREKWITQHLRCVKASLLKTIPENYLKINGEWIKCCTDMAEMYWCLEKSNGKHMNNGFPCVVYNKFASMQYENSYYNKDKSKEKQQYRESVETYLKNYKIN